MHGFVSSVWKRAESQIWISNTADHIEVLKRSANVGDTMIIGLCKGLISLRIKVKYVSSHVTPTFLFTIAMFILLVALHGKGMWWWDKDIYYSETYHDYLHVKEWRCCMSAVCLVKFNLRVLLPTAQCWEVFQWCKILCTFSICITGT